MQLINASKDITISTKDKLVLKKARVDLNHVAVLYLDQKSNKKWT